MTKHITVVYTVHDEEAFEPTRQQIIESMNSTENAPFAVTAVSLDHEMQRTHWCEIAAEEIGDYYGLKEALENIVGHPDIASVKPPA